MLGSPLCLNNSNNLTQAINCNYFFSTNDDCQSYDLCRFLPSKNFVLKSDFLSQKIQNTQDLFSSKDTSLVFNQPKEEPKLNPVVPYFLNSIESKIENNSNQQVISQDFTNKTQNINIININYIFHFNKTQNLPLSAPITIPNEPHSKILPPALPVPPKASLEDQPKKIKMGTPEEIITSIKTHSGCRYYQNKIRENPSFANRILFDILKPKIVELINDQFGNYLCQEFLGVLNEEHLRYFIEIVSKNSSEIFFSPHGTRVVQKLLDFISQENEIGNLVLKNISEKIKEKISVICQDENANHIVQKYLTLVSCQDHTFIFEEVYKSFLSIATSKVGCCVIQKCLIYGDKEEKLKIANLVLTNTFFLIGNQYGNYVYQTLIMTTEDWVVSLAFKIISKDIMLLSKEKYSSNVIEKFFERNNKNLVNKIAYSMILLQNESKIFDLLCSHYGNYIIQKILETVSDEIVINKILGIIQKNTTKINKISFGKKMFIKLRKKYPILSTYVNIV